VPNEPARLLTTREAADAIGVPRNTLQRWAHGGIVTPADTTTSGHRRWDLDDLRAQMRRYLNDRMCAVSFRRRTSPGLALRDVEHRHPRMSE